MSATTICCGGSFQKARVYLTMPQKMSVSSPTVSTVCRERFWDTKPLKSCSTTISTAFTPLDTTTWHRSALLPSTLGFATPSGNQRGSTLICYIFENYCNLILQHDFFIFLSFGVRRGQTKPRRFLVSWGCSKRTCS